MQRWWWRERGSGWRRRDQALERGVAQQPGIGDLLDGIKNGGGMAEEFEMTGMVHIGAEIFDISFFDEKLREISHFGAIVAGERKEIELEQTANFTELVVPGLIAGEIEITLGVGEHRLVAF